jgi:hypothetical protein
VVLVVLVAIILYAVYWFSSRAYLEITVTSGGNDAVSYELRDVVKEKDIKLPGNQKTIKKLVPKSNYQLFVKQGESSYFSFLDTGGFFSTKKVTVTLQAERARTYVGYNPEPCMHLTAGVLLTYTCGGTYGTAQLHKPATDTLPTSVQKNTNTFSGTLEGIFKTKEGDMVVIRAPEVDEDEGPPHSAYFISGSLRLTNGTALNLDLITYHMQAFRDGFLAYNDSFKNLHYFALVKQDAVALPGIVATNKSLKPRTIDTKGEALAAVFSSDENSNEDATSEIVVRGQADKDSAKHFNFPETYKSVVLCATDRLCLLDKKSRLEVYDITKDKNAKFLFSLPDVKAIEDSDSGLLVVNKKGIFTLNLEAREGHMQYSFGPYTFCGLKAVDTTYLVCIDNNVAGKAVLHINPAGVSDSIDKKIVELLRTEGVAVVSVYGRYIHVSPDGGPTIRDANGRFARDPRIGQTNNQKVKEAITRLGIDTSYYHVKSSLD